MSILKTIVPKLGRTFVPPVRRSSPQDRRQRELMIGSLCLLVLALGIVLYHDRDFWFPDDSDDADQPTTTPITIATDQPTTITQAPKTAVSTNSKSAISALAQPKHKALQTRVKARSAAPAIQAPPDDDPSPIKVTSRTALPPLDVEVVAGDTHRVLRPGNNSLHVDLQPDSAPQLAASAPVETAASVTANASERIEMHTNASTLVADAVKPSYPLLAQRMKVQGSVILKALIGKDGVIQNLRIVSGPPILASAAEDAVRQWHFKPHLVANEAVETEARITVNFTISTN